MVKENVRIKDNITIVDKISVIQSISNYYFTDGEYTPYYEEMAKVTAIAQNFLDGVTFDSSDYIYELVMNDEELKSLVNKFTDFPTGRSDSQYYTLMDNIMSDVNKIVEFEKQKIIHGTHTMEIIGEICEGVVTVLNRIADVNSPENIQMAKDFMEEVKKNGITEETLANAVRKAADKFKLPESDVIEGQRQRISEQQEQLKEKEAEIQELRKWKRDHMARNVMNTRQNKTTAKSVKGSGIVEMIPKEKSTEGVAKKAARKSSKKSES